MTPPGGSEAGVDAAERAVLARIDREAVVALASDLVAIPSVSMEEEPAVAAVADQLERIGMAVERFDTPVERIAGHAAFSSEFPRETLPGAIGSVGDAQGTRLLFDGHVDVVPPGRASDWTSPAFTPTVRGGRLYGRGACDMKGGLAAAIHAVDAIVAAGIELAGQVLVAPVAAEEDGGSGTLALLERGLQADACVVMEPTGGAVAPAVAGALSWRIGIRGLSAHGCLREEGVSAIEAFHPVHHAVLELERRRNARAADSSFDWLEVPFAICGGRIAGGDWPSSEADWLTWEGRYGVAPGEDLAAARAELEDAVAAAAADDPWLASHPPTVEWWGGQFLPAATPQDDPLVKAVRAAADTVQGTPAPLRAMPYGCDAGLTRGIAGIPTIVYGPGDIRDAHRPDESVSIDDLVASARVYALTILRICGVAGVRG